MTPLIWGAVWVLIVISCFVFMDEEEQDESS